MNIPGILRGTARATCFLGFVLTGWTQYWLGVRGLPVGEKRRAQAEWLHRWSRRICRLLNVSVDVRGTPPTAGLIVSNHLSYLDVFVLSAIEPCVFVAKSEIGSWPIFGPCAQCAGTILIDRTRRAAVGPVAAEMAEVLAAGLPLVLFPEGTTSFGDGVLPFKSALFGPVIELNSNVTAAAIDFELPGGSAATEVCFVGEVALLPHLWNLITKARVLAHVSFAAPHAPMTDRKALAHEMHSAVTALHQAQREPRAS